MNLNSVHNLLSFDYNEMFDNYRTAIQALSSTTVQLTEMAYSKLSVHHWLSVYPDHNIRKKTSARWFDGEIRNLSR